MKKILHISHTDIRSDSRILKEMDSLLLAGYSVTGLGIASKDAASHSVASFDFVIDSMRLHLRGINILPKLLKYALTYLELAGRVIPKALSEKPDVVHCHDFVMLPLAVIVKLFTRAKLIYDAHELESQRNGLPKIYGKLIYFVEKILWRFIDGLIVVSPSIEEWYMSNCGHKRSAVVLNSPVFSEKNIKNNSYLRTKFNISANDKIFIYVGMLVGGRGLDLIVETFSDDNIKSHIVFMGYGEYKEELKKYESENYKIHVHDAVPHSDVVPIVRSADFGLCLIQNVSMSDYFCLPNKLFEYCFAGVPVLASDFPDIRMLVNDYKIGECTSLEIDEIKRSVAKLGNSKTLYEFNDLTPLGWDMQAENIKKLYKDLC